MASSPIPPIRPTLKFVDENGILTREGYEYIQRMVTLLNQLRTAALAAGWVL